MKQKEIRVARELTRVIGRMVVLFTELGEVGETGWRGGESLCSLVAVKASHFASV